jgi:hypothetical protein
MCCSSVDLPHTLCITVCNDVKVSSATDEPRPGEDLYNTWFPHQGMKERDGSVEDAEQGSSKLSKLSM